MAPVARTGTRLPPLAPLGSQGILGRQGCHRTRNQAQRTVQTPDLRDFPRGPRRNVAGAVLWGRTPAMGIGLPAPRQRLAEFARRHRAADDLTLAGHAAQADPRQRGAPLPAVL